MIFHEISVDFRGLRKFVEIEILVESRSEIDKMSRKSSLGQSKVSLIEKFFFRFFLSKIFSCGGVRKPAEIAVKCLNLQRSLSKSKGFFRKKMKKNPFSPKTS